MARNVRPAAWLLLPAAAFLLLAPVAGCSSHGTVSGKITYQGEPLRGGTVVFTSGGGKVTRSAEVGPDGSYIVADVPTGEARITVDTRFAQPPPWMESGRGPPRPMQPPPDVQLPPGAENNTIYKPKPRSAYAQKIPEEFGDPDKSGLSYAVTAGPQTHDLDLK